MVENRGPQLAGVLGTFLGLVWIFVGLRLYVRGALSKSFGLDDGFLVAAVIFFTTYAACSLSGVKYGTGRHVTDIPLTSIPVALYYWWLCEIFYNVTTVLLRLSISIFLMRICVKKIHFYIIYANIFMIVSFAIFYLFLIIFQCSPSSYFWLQYAGEKGTCINAAIVPNATLAHSAISFVSDLILSILPIFLVKDLKMNTRTKSSVAAILGMGILAGTATLIRIPYVRVLQITDDFLFATTDVAIWSTVEPGLGICAASAATFRPLFRTFYSLSTHPGAQNTPAYIRTANGGTWRNSRAGYIKSVDVGSGTRTEGSGSDSLELQGMGRSETRNEISSGGRAGIGRKASKKFREMVGEEVGGSRKGLGGIQIQQTVQIERVNALGEPTGNSEPQTPWPLEEGRGEGR